MAKRGFTLVEVMIVVAIVGILATFAQINYVTGLKKARDGKRKADLEQIRSALEMARSDSPDGVYPDHLDSLWGVYMEEPAVKTGYEFHYHPSLDKLTYTLWVCLEYEHDPAGIVETGCASGKKYEVENP